MIDEQELFEHASASMGELIAHALNQYEPNVQQLLAKEIENGAHVWLDLVPVASSWTGKLVTRKGIVDLFEIGPEKS